jgi:CxxC motif-containing protein (DUF1111 family)
MEYLARLSGLVAASAVLLATAADLDPRALSAGVFTTSAMDAAAYSQSGPLLAGEKAAKRFSDGHDALNQRWVLPFLAGGPWGRGPVSNGEACADCHLNNGRGRAPTTAEEPMRSMLVRLSVAGDDGHGGPAPHPQYGGQLNYQGVPERVPGEGEAHVIWQERTVAFADGEETSLRMPKIELRSLSFGPLGESVMISPRVAPPLIGLGLLEAVPDAAILALAKQDKPHGIKGKANLVWDVAGKRTTLGRFGLKANQPNLAQQIMAAFHEDLGITSDLFPEENCRPAQKACQELIPGGRPELLANQFNPLLFYLRANAVPARRSVDDPEVQRGEQLFKEAACAVCHQPEMKTGAYEALPELSQQTIHPYTDLLLHDMGEDLADRRPDYRAGGGEWRTPPLWGLGLLKTVSGHTELLHDARARNASEAILWHGGEGAYSREAFRNMSKAERSVLLKFLDSL